MTLINLILEILDQFTTISLLEEHFRTKPLDKDPLFLEGYDKGYDIGYQAAQSAFAHKLSFIRDELRGEK
jgi:hypothetical protein